MRKVKATQLSVVSVRQNYIMSDKIFLPNKNEFIFMSSLKAKKHTGRNSFIRH